MILIQVLFRAATVQDGMHGLLKNLQMVYNIVRAKFLELESVKMVDGTNRRCTWCGSGS